MKPLIVLFCLIAFSLSAQKTPYTIKIKLQTPAKKIYLETLTNNGFMRIDSTEIVKGKGELKGYVPQPDAYYLSRGEENERVLIFLGNSDIFASDWDSSNVLSLRFKASSLQDQYEAFKDKLFVLEGVEEEIYDMYQDAKQIGADLKTEYLEATEAVKDSMYQARVNFIKTHFNSPVALYVLREISSSMSGDELQGYIDSFDPNLSNLFMLVNLKDQAEKFKKLGNGNQAPDFEMNNIHGEPIKLSDIYSKNKYTLIHFWNYECGDCRSDNSKLLALYKEYKKKGFGILGVSLETDRFWWKAGLKEDRIPWTEVSDLSKKNMAADLFGITTTPMSYLIDNQGRIVAKNLMGTKLKIKLAELLDK